MNILGSDGGYAPIAPGPLDSSRGRGRGKNIGLSHLNINKYRSTSEPPRSPPLSATTSAASSPPTSPNKPAI